MKKIFFTISFLFFPMVAMADCDCGSVDINNPCTGNSVEYSRTGGSFSNQFGGFSVNDTIVRFEFDCNSGECKCGKFANGRDYWVAPVENEGVVTISKIVPDATGIGESYKNGAMFGPTTREASQGYDGRTTATSRFGAYDENLSLQIPINISPYQEGRAVTILKSVSTKHDNNCSPEVRICLDQLETLTIVNHPPGDIFRPSYFGTEKEVFSADLFDDSFLSNMELLEGSMSWDQALETMMGIRAAVHLDNQNLRQGFSAVLNYFPPGAYADGYDGYVGTNIQKVILKLTEKAEGENAIKKRQLAKYMAQYGIDLWSVFTNPDPGDPCGHWEANGGFNNNYLVPILFANKLLGQGWSIEINSVMETQNGKNCFAETGFVQPSSVTQIGKGVPLFGNVEGNLGIENYTCSSNANNININFLTDGLGRGRVDGDVCQDTGSGCPTPYMSCCTHGHWLASAMAVWLTPALFNDFPENGKHWLDYVDRSRSAGVQVGAEFGAYCDPNSFNVSGFDTGYDTQLAYNMWNNYRDCSKSQTCDGMTLYYSEEIRSDVDGSSAITTTDALLTLRNSLGLSMTGTAWRASLITGDVNCDGVSNSTDALLILRYSLGLSISGTGWCAG